MILRNLRLILFVLSLLITQFLINNLSIFYVDLLGIVLIITLIENKSSWLVLVILSLVADLFGHWYLGSHSLAILLLSGLTTRVSRFYLLCGWVNRNVIANFFFVLMSAVIYLIDVILGKSFSSLPSAILELFVLMPLVQLAFGSLVHVKSAEFIWHE